MLYGSVIAIMAVVTAIAVPVALFSHVPTIWVFVGWACLLLFSLLFERTHYKAELTARPARDWVATNELTIDARGTVRVWFHPGTGERVYVREAAR